MWACVARGLGVVPCRTAVRVSAMDAATPTEDVVAAVGDAGEGDSCWNKLVKKLKAEGYWPRGDAPVVFTGAKARDLPRNLKPRDQARVQGFTKSLTRGHGNASGMDWELLNSNPAAAACTLIDTAAEFMASIGRTPDTANARPWNADTAEERAFRRSLHTSKAAAFRLP